MKNILKLFPYIKGMYARIAGVAGFSLLLAAVVAYHPQIYKTIVDTVVRQGGNLVWADLSGQLWLLLALSLITVAMSYGFNMLTMQAMLAARTILRVNVFEKLTHLGIEYFETNRPGAINQRVQDGIGSFVSWVNTLNYSLLGPIFSLLIITTILFFKDFWLGSLSIAIVVFPSWEYMRMIKLNKEPNRAWRKSNETGAAIAVETVQNMATLATLSSFESLRHKFARESATGQKLGIKVRGDWQASQARVTLFNEMALVIAIVVVLGETINGRFSAGEFVALITYFGTVRGNARQLAQFIPSTDDVERDVERLIEVLETETSFPDSPDAIELRQLQSIEFKAVSFAYPESSKGAISDISFRIDASKSVALVGPSGVGKSTITKLLLRFYAPTSGEIYINDRPASSFTHESVRQHIGMVMQDVALFNTTVKENLKLANAKATKAQLQDAADQAYASEFIDELPKQYNTLVGERGVKLSGGQKQRIAIARAILKNPDLIILDEATSALDSESERLVQAGLKQLMRGRLSLTIAHRLSTVRHADEIIVLKGGKIAERGRHPELIAQEKGLYRRLFELQSATGEVKL